MLNSSLLLRKFEHGGSVVSVYGFEDANVDVDPPPCRDLVKCDVSVREGVKNGKF